MADDEVRISTSMDAELEAALARLDARLGDVEDKLHKVRRAGRGAGEGIEAGMGKAKRSIDETRRSSEKAAPAIDDVGDKASKTGTKATVAATGVDRFARSMRRARRAAGGLGSVLTIFKWASIATGIFALAGGLSALAAGAVIAVGGLAPMVGVLGAIPALFATAKLSMLAFTLASKAMEGTLTRIKNQFTELGEQIASGGLRSGLSFFADHLDRLAAVTGRGLASLGGQLGLAAREAGRLVDSAPFLSQVNRIFNAMEPVVGKASSGIINLGRALLNVIEASMPMVQSMAAAFASMAHRLQQWTAAQLDSGRMTAWMNKAWDIFRRTVHVVVDILVGLFNILRVGAGYAGDMGTSIEDAAAKFRAWTGSASGQARINRYFLDSLPALREMGRLAAFLGRGLGGLSTNANLAPLLGQINDELMPALGRLVKSFAGQGGLGSALISAAAALADLFSELDLGALVAFAQAIAAIARGILWISANVPGAGWAISTLISAFLAFKLLGPVFSMVAGGAKAFSWLSAASKMTGELSAMQRVVGGALLPVLRTMAGFLLGPLVTAINGVGIALKAAFITSPVGWIVLAIVALVVAVIYAWTHFAWFRDAVIGAWDAIKAAAGAVADFFVSIWRGAVNQVVALWNWLVSAWNSTVSVIATSAMWIWDHGLKQVVNIIVVGFKVAFAIVAFIVQTAVYVIVAVVAVLATVFERFWHWVSYWAALAWNSVIFPIIRFFVMLWQGMVAGVSAAWNWLIGGISAGWNWLYVTTIAPVINAIRVGWQGLVSGLSFAWTWLVGGLSAGWRWFSGVVSSVVGFIRTIWGSLTSWLSTVFTPVGHAIGLVFDGIGAAAKAAGSVVKGVWDAIVGAVKAVWNFIARGWNAIPSISVPDWVPGIGGSEFGLPKLPILYAGGQTPGGPALVGEHGPELYVRGSRIAGLLGAGGPEVANLPRGGYVLPNLNTMAAGMAKSIPAPVASVVARAAPAYANAGAAHDSALAGAVRALAANVAATPPLNVQGGEDTRAAVLDALRTFKREERARGQYDYEAGQG